MNSLLLSVLIIKLLAIVSSSGLTDDEDRGFIVHKHQCGGKFLLRDSAILEAVDYPDDHQFHKECIWKLKVSYEYNVALIFNSINLEDDCKSNYLVVRDGMDDEDPLIGIFCGKNTPLNLLTREDGIYVKFVSNAPMKNSSFSARVVRTFDECRGNRGESENPYILPDGWHPENICDKTFGPTETQGKIESPCFPGLYSRKRNCVWKILAPPGVRINLNFKKINLPIYDNHNGTEVCGGTFIEVSSLKEDDILKEHGRFCGSSLPKSIISEGNILELIFKSSSYYNHDFSGFAAEFSHESKN